MSIIETKSNININDAGFTIGTYNSLHRAGINNLEELSKMSKKDLYSIRSFGLKNLKEVSETLMKFGYQNDLIKSDNKKDEKVNLDIGYILLDDLNYLKNTKRRYFTLADNMSSNKKNNFDDYKNMDHILTLDVLNRKLKYNNIQDINFLHLRSHLCSLYSWRRYKKIYSINDLLLEDLKFQASNIDHNEIYLKDLISTLPFNGFFIDINMDDIKGIFVNVFNPPYYIKNDLSSQKEGIEKVLNFSVLTNYETEKMYPLEFGIYKNNISFYESNNIDKKLGLFVKVRDYKYTEKKYYDNINLFFSILSYITCINSDICDTINKSYKGIKPKALRDRYDEIQQIGLGFCYRSSNLEFKNSENLSSHNSYISNKKKIPHVRRGHFQSFWVGKKDSDQRHKVIKWVNPIYVNGYTEDTNISGISKIENYL